MVEAIGLRKSIERAWDLATNPGHDQYSLSSARVNGFRKFLSNQDLKNGMTQFDCSSFVSAILSKAFGQEKLMTTETMFDELPKMGFKLIAHNQDWDAKFGDIVILSPGGKGTSAGAFGHVVIFDNDNGNSILQSNAGFDGVVGGDLKHFPGLSQTWSGDGKNSLYDLLVSINSPLANDIQVFRK